MGRGASADRFRQVFEEYVDLLEAIGHTVHREALLERVSGEGGGITVLNGAAKGRETATVPPGALRRIETLRDDLRQQIESGISGEDREESGEEELEERLRDLPEPARDHLADIVMQDGHRPCLEKRFLAVEEFQQMLAEYAGDQTLARSSLIDHLRREFRRRGYEMSCEAIEERFRADPLVRRIPYCAGPIIRELGDEFRTGLIPIENMVGEEDPGLWLDRTRRRLRFRSERAMHRAVAQSTSLTYACVHKALSGRERAKRIQVEIKECLEGWLEKLREGQPLPVDDEHRGIPVEEVYALLPRLKQKFETKQAIYRAIAQKTDLKPGSIRRYFQEQGGLKTAPLAVYREACRLAGGGAEQALKGREDCREGEGNGEHQTVASLASRTNEALKQWKSHRGEGDFKEEFRSSRLELIRRLARCTDGV